MLRTHRPYLLAGLFAGALSAVAAAALAAPRLMLSESSSPYGVDETVKRISANAEAAGWVVSSVVNMNESVKKHGGGTFPAVRLVNLCQAKHAEAILASEQARVVSVMMPCTVSVYEKADGKTYVASMNASLMGRLFGGVVADVMGGPVARDQERILTLG